MENIITQLKRRQVFKVATIYAVSAWPLIQLADLAVPALGLPDSVLTLLLKIFIAGFPASLIFAWLFNFTHKGIVRATTETDEDNLPQANVRTTIAVAGALSVILVVTIGSQLLLDEHQPVTEAAALKPPTAARVAPALSDNGKESIAILPFVPFSNDPNDEFFADGMVEELLNLLAKLPDLQVAARTSSFAYKGITDKTIPEIGRELGVDTILEGSIRKNDTTNKIRVTAQLIKVSTGDHLWSETYDREYKDIFQIQDDIANAVVEKMKITLLGEGQAEIDKSHFVAPTDSVEAMVAYGKGQRELGHRTAVSISTALEHFTNAINIDPNYARAYVGIADANNLLALYGNLPPKDARAAAQDAIDKAMAIDDNLAEAYAAQGLLSRKLDTQKAEASFKKAMALNPNYAMTYMWYATLLQSRGEVETAHKLLEKAFMLDPKSPVAAYLLAWSYYDSGQEEKTMELFSHIIANDPYYPEAYNLVGQILLKRGRLDESITMFKRSLDVDALNKGAVRGLLMANMDMGNLDITQQWFDYAQKHDELFSQANMNQLKSRYHLVKGDKYKALDYLNQVSFEEGDKELHGLYLEGQKAYYQGNYNGVVSALEQARFQKENNENAFYKRGGGRIAANLAYAYAQLEMTDKLNELLSGLDKHLETVKQKQLNNSSYYYTMALVKALQHKPDEAFYFLQGAIDVGWVQVWAAEAEPIFSSVKDDIQFTLMMGGVQARLANMRTRMADEEEFMLAGNEEI